MSQFLATLADLLMKSVIVAFAANEVRGLILAGPVLYGIYQAGGTLMAIWLGISSLGGIALSVLVPVFLDKRFSLRGRLRAIAKTA
jgi:hypothetical protein